MKQKRQRRKDEGASRRESMEQIIQDGVWGAYMRGLQDGAEGRHVGGGATAVGEDLLARLVSAWIHGGGAHSDNVLASRLGASVHAVRRETRRAIAVGIAKQNACGSMHVNIPGFTYLRRLRAAAAEVKS